MQFCQLLYNEDGSHRIITARRTLRISFCVQGFIVFQPNLYSVYLEPICEFYLYGIKKKTDQLKLTYNGCLKAV